MAVVLVLWAMSFLSYRQSALELLLTSAFGFPICCSFWRSIVLQRYLSHSAVLGHLLVSGQRRCRSTTKIWHFCLRPFVFPSHYWVLSSVLALISICPLSFPLQCLLMPLRQRLQGLLSTWSRRFILILMVENILMSCVVYLSTRIGTVWERKAKGQNMGRWSVRGRNEMKKSSIDGGRQLTVVCPSAIPLSRSLF